MDPLDSLFLGPGVSLENAILKLDILSLVTKFSPKIVKSQ